MTNKDLKQVVGATYRLMGDVAGIAGQVAELCAIAQDPALVDLEMAGERLAKLEADLERANNAALAELPPVHHQGGDIRPGCCQDHWTS